MRLSSAVGAARWYQGKGAGEPQVRITARLRPPGAGEHELAVLAVGDDAYVAPLDAAGALADDAPELWRALASAAVGGAELVGDGCRLIGRAGPAAAPDLGGAVRGIGADQTNTTVVLGERAVLKCYRRLGPGAAREPARVRGLTAAGFDGVPAMYAAAELEAGRVSSALLLVQAYVPGTWDGFAQADRDLRAGAAPGWAPAVGRLVGRMHRALGPGRPATEDDLAAWRAHGRTLVAAMAGDLSRSAGAALDMAWDAAARGPLPPVAPAHGDLHLAQLLFGPGGPEAVIDFEPAPSVLARPVARDARARPRGAAALGRQRRALDGGAGRPAAGGLDSRGARRDHRRVRARRARGGGPARVRARPGRPRMSLRRRDRAVLGGRRAARPDHAAGGAMRDLIFSMAVSLDGYVAGPGGDIGWTAPEPELHRFYNERTRECGVQLCGRRLYEEMLYWETIDPAAAEPEREFAAIWQALPKVVFSSTLERVEGNATLAHEGLAETVAQLKAEPGGALEVGGATLAAEATRLGLIDEYRLFAFPVVLGGGTPCFPPLDAQMELELAETRTFAGGVVLLRYRRA